VIRVNVETLRDSSVRLKRFYLGKPYESIYFTAREASCMWHFLNNKTIIEAAAALQLSPRTVEFYANNMKTKLSCYSKAELVKRVLKSEFIHNYLQTEESERLGNQE